MDTDSRIQVPFNAIEDHISCSICLSVMKGAVLTPCGHRYCSRCITEWVVRNHTCPCCNSPLNSSQFYCDVQFDTLVDAILIERDKSEERLYDKLLFQDLPENSGSQKTSAFLDVLKKHMKMSVLSHQRYFEQIHSEYERKIMKLETDVEENKSDLKETLRKNLDDSEQLALNTFDKYLKDNVPDLVLIPVIVSVYLPDRDLRIPNVIFKPSDSLSVIKPLITTAILDKMDKILSWHEDGGVRLLFGPLSKSNKYNMKEILSCIEHIDGMHVLTWNSKPILQHSMRPGSEIVLHGVFQSESDLPKKCFAQTFVKSAPQSCDYFACHRCNVKWICKSCAQSCHRGHKVSPFAINHIPNWACCYCPKKRLCMIQQTDL